MFYLYNTLQYFNHLYLDVFIPSLFDDFQIIQKWKILAILFWKDLYTPYFLQ
jgi:hypothetical protein